MLNFKQNIQQILKKLSDLTGEVEAVHGDVETVQTALTTIETDLGTAQEDIGVLQEQTSELLDDGNDAYQDRADLVPSLESDGYVLKASVTLSNDRLAERNYIIFAYCTFSNDSGSEWYEAALGENVDNTYGNANVFLQEGKVIDHQQNGLVHFVYPVALDAAANETTPTTLDIALWVRQAAGGAGLIAEDGTIKVIAL